MHAQQLESVLISTAGRPGIPGTLHWSGENNFEAPPLNPGRPGQPAAAPSAGTAGRDIWVKLGYAQDQPGIVQLSGDRLLTGKRWEISPGQVADLDCRGGDGGHGGIGENGQRGGQGKNGRDATRYSDGTSGGQGFPGGDGGKGTNGANGGDAGNVYITVGEEDLDTLVAVQWMVSGGRGGARGVHGEPGAGGRGGLGGAPYSWTETHSYIETSSDGTTHTRYYNTHHSRPGAPPGADGREGMRRSEPLHEGLPGRNGKSQIRVVRHDSTEEIFPSRYQLIVKDFDVIDENMDGIFEPGEFLLVQNLVVENVGGMPSPKGNMLKILIRHTPWLEPVRSGPLELPREIAPGTAVRVPGVLKALIKSESSPRAPGTTFHAKDTVRLAAFFERLQRPVPEFSGAKDVSYQYPLVMSVPKYLDCVAKGDVVRLSWLVRNISTKAYGVGSASHRPSFTRMSDPRRVFDIRNASQGSPHEISDEIHIIEPGTEIPVIQEFQVSQSAPIFSTGYIVISLLLSDPHTGVRRSITFFELSIQISSSYSYNPFSQFLLVINSSTPNDVILQTMDFINNGLYLPLDIFNLSLVGSFRNPGTEHNLLWDYEGKTVIIFGNPMNYFQFGSRHVWDLLDPWEACMLAKMGVRFLFVCPTSMNGLKAWASEMASPVAVLQALPAQLVATPAEIAPRLLSGKEEFPNTVLTLSVKKGIFNSLDTTMQRQARLITKQLTKRLPLRRFVIGPSESIPSNQDSAGRKFGDLAVVEGLPHWAKIAVSLQPYTSGHGLSDYNIAMIVYSLAFRDQCAIFWNLLGSDYSSGISASLAYRGNELSHLHGDCWSSVDFEKDFIFNGKACEALSWSIATQLASELSHFCLKSPWPDASMSKSDIILQLPLLQQFVETQPPTLTIASELGISPLAAVLGLILGTQAPLGFGQWLCQNLLRIGSRKAKVNSIVQQRVGSFARGLRAPEWQKELCKGIRASYSVTKKSLAQTKRFQPSLNRVERVHKLNCLRLEELTQTESAWFLDLNALIGVQRSMNTSEDELSERRRKHADWMMRIQKDEAWSTQMLEDLVNPEGKVQ